ncbi:MAG: F0F1 ATP synthase subunit epsilon [Desulfovibrio sp.]|nr:MAG: F0F1 ATP synthase subunit epsilon [Desulfovibrio sp.]
MEKTLQLEIVTPDQQVLSETVDYVGAPGFEGEFGVLANHIPFLSALNIGNLYYKKDGKTRYVFVSGGFADVSNNKITILAESAEKAEDIDVERAMNAKDRAEKRLAQQKDMMEYAAAQAALQRALFRLKAKETAG